jgi:hypothetical protein
MTESLLSEMEKGNEVILKMTPNYYPVWNYSKFETYPTAYQKKSIVESQNYIISILPVQGRILGIVL